MRLPARRLVLAITLAGALVTNTEALAQGEFLGYGKSGAGALASYLQADHASGFNLAFGYSISGWLDPGIAFSRVGPDYAKSRQIGVGIDCHMLRPLLKSPIQPSLSVMYVFEKLEYSGYYYDGTISDNFPAATARLYARIKLGHDNTLIPQAVVSWADRGTGRTAYGPALSIGIGISRSQILVIDARYMDDVDFNTGTGWIGIGTVLTNPR